MKRTLVLLGLLLTGGASLANMDVTFATFHDQGDATGHFRAEMGPKDPGHAYEDVHNTGTFVNGTDVKIEDHELADGTYHVQDPDHGLVLPESVDPITAPTTLHLSAGDNGHLILHTSLTSDKDLHLQAGTTLHAPEVTLTAGRDANLTANQDLHLNGTHLEAARDGDVRAGGQLDLEDARIGTDRDATLTAEGTLRGYNATLEASRDANVHAGDGLLLVHAHLTAERNLHLEAGQDARLNDATLNAKRALNVQAGQDVLVTRATLDTHQDITLTAGSTEDAVFVQDARFLDKDETATVAPHGVEIVGEPAQGSTEYASEDAS